jgi:hypothetical protein
MARLTLIAGVLVAAGMSAALAQGSTANTPTCPAGTQVTTPGSTTDPKAAATRGVRQPARGAAPATAPPGAAQNTAVRVGNGLARLPDGSLCRPIDG